MISKCYNQLHLFCKERGNDDPSHEMGQIIKLVNYCKRAFSSARGINSTCCEFVILNVALHQGKVGQAT